MLPMPLAAFIANLMATAYAWGQEALPRRGPDADFLCSRSKCDAPIVTSLSCSGRPKY